jgi:hypothetical protein
VKKVLIPIKTMICKLADGHPVRVVDYNPTTGKIRLKSLRTGLPFAVNKAEVFRADEVPA